MQTDIFKKVPIEVPNRSGFDESHSNVFTATTGTLTPCFVQELLPNDSVSLGVATQISLPPAATDFYGRIRGFFEFFFVPNRLLWGDWQRFITQTPDGATQGTIENQYLQLPQLMADFSDLGVTSLADYLGAKGFVPVNWTAGGDGRNRIYNPLRFLAYHKIYDDWYRDSRLQNQVFRPLGPSDSPGYAVWQLPYLSYSNTNLVFDKTIGETRLADGVDVFSLRQRNWARDYFTNATPLPQAGTGAGVAFSIQNNTGEFSIASLRAANSLQQFLERMNIAGARYGDQIKAQFGVYPSDAALDRAIYLGRQVVDVYNRTVYQTNADPNNSFSPYNNPFNSVGTKYASPMAVGDGSIIDNFTATEHGVLMGIFSLVPDAMYAMSSHRAFSYRHPQDFPFPLLAGVGDQDIYLDELTPADGVFQPGAGVIGPGSGTFGYTQRYAEAKFMIDEVHGLLRDDSLGYAGAIPSFALQRSFDSSNPPALGSQFIEIPKDYLDQVMAVTIQNSFYSCWVESYFSYKKISTLPAYSIPTLGDMKNTHTETIPNGGTRL